jgi:hypothetical protein
MDTVSAPHHVVLSPSTRGFNADFFRATSINTGFAVGKGNDVTPLKLEYIASLIIISNFSSVK